MEAFHRVLYLLTDFQPLLSPLVIVATALLAWRVQLNVLARRAAWDFIAQHEQSAEWLKAADDTKLRLTGKSSASDWGRWRAREPEQCLSARSSTPVTKTMCNRLLYAYICRIAFVSGIGSADSLSLIR